MSGWKTWAAAALCLVYGVAGFFLELHGAGDAMNYIVTGLGLVGIGHKIEKAGAAWEGRKDADLQDLLRRDRADR